MKITSTQDEREKAKERNSTRCMTKGFLGNPQIPLMIKLYLDPTGNMLSREMGFAEPDSAVMSTKELLPY